MNQEINVCLIGLKVKHRGVWAMQQFKIWKLVQQFYVITKHIIFYLLILKGTGSPKICMLHMYNACPLRNAINHNILLLHNTLKVGFNVKQDRA